MVASQPATLPITTADATNAAAASAATTAVVLVYLGRLSDTVHPALSLRRPWLELLDRNALSHPDSLSDVAARLRKNLAYFGVNYLIVVAAVLTAYLASNPVSLLLLALLAAVAFFYVFRPADSPPLVLMGRQFSDRETLLALVCITVFVLLLTSVSSVVVSALALGSAIVVAHGAFRIPEDLFLDGQESAGSGVSLLSFLTGGSAVSSAAVPAVAARV